MLDANRRPLISLTEGYALCTPGGTLLGHTYRECEEDAIATVFAAPRQDADPWALAMSEGWTAQHVYARIFSPRFYVDVTGEPAAVEQAGATMDEAGQCFVHREPGEFGEGATVVRDAASAIIASGGDHG